MYSEGRMIGEVAKNPPLASRITTKFDLLLQIEASIHGRLAETMDSLHALSRYSYSIAHMLSSKQNTVQITSSELSRIIMWKISGGHENDMS